MAVICGWVIISTALIYALQLYSVPPKISALAEVTAGVTMLGKNTSVYFIAFLVGFGGVSVAFQVISNAGAVSPRFSALITERISAGLFTALFTYLGLKIFKVSTAAAGSIFGVNLYADSVVSAGCLVVFVLTSFAFINKAVKKCGKNKKYMLQ